MKWIKTRSIPITKYLRMKLLASTLAVLLCLSLTAQQIINPTDPHTMAVTGDAIIRVTPDQVVLRLGIQYKGEDLVATKKETAAIIEKAINYCKKHGIPSKYIQTDYLSIQPNYTNHRQSQISHYTVQQVLCLVIEDVPQYETMLTDLLLLGINRVDNIEFRTTKVKEYRKQVRKMAIQAAKDKATFLASETDMDLGKIVNVMEYSPSHNQHLGSANYANFSQNIVQQTDNSADGSPLSIGLISLKSTVTLTYMVL